MSSTGRVENFLEYVARRRCGVWITSNDPRRKTLEALNFRVDVNGLDPMYAGFDFCSTRGEYFFVTQKASNKNTNSWCFSFWFSSPAVAMEFALRFA